MDIADTDSTDSTNSTDSIKNTDMIKYYKLKEKYEEERNRRKTLIKDKGYGINETKKRIQNLIMKCVSCNRKGGTIFEEENGTLRAVCGVKGIEKGVNLKPCDLNLVVKRKFYDNMRDLEQNNMKKVDSLKMGIIMAKLDFLFGFNSSKDEVVDKFNNLKQELATISETQLINNKKYADIISGIHREPLLAEYKGNLMLEIETLKELYKQYKEEEQPQPQLLKAMVETYIDNILPLTEKIRNINYHYYALEMDEKTIMEKYQFKEPEPWMMSRLISEPYLYTQLEQERK